MDPTLAAQGNISNGTTATPALGRKPQGDSPAAAGSGPLEGSSGVTAAMPAFARAMEGLTSAAGAGSLRDPGTPLSASLQTSPKTSEHNVDQANGTALTDSDSIPAGSLADLTQARVLHSLSGSEMHINLNSEEFGRVSVHAAYGRDSITTQISLENSTMGNALGSALSAHLSTLETKLGQEHGLPSSVSLATHNGSDTGSPGQGRSGDPQSQSRQFPGSGHPTSHASAVSQSSLSSDGTFATDQSTPTLTEASSGRLDIRI